MCMPAFSELASSQRGNDKETEIEGDGEGRHLAWASAHFNFHKTYMRRMLSAHFTDENRQALRGYATCLKLHGTGI